MTDYTQSDIGLILVIGNEQLDLDVRILRDKLVDCLLRAGDAGWTFDVAVDARHIGDMSNSDRGGRLRPYQSRAPDGRGRGNASPNENAAIEIHFLLLHELRGYRI